MGKNLPSQDAEVIDGRDKFIYPGLINTHHHFFQTFVRNLMTIDYPNICWWSNGWTKSIDFFKKLIPRLVEAEFKTPVDKLI